MPDAEPLALSKLDARCQISRNTSWVTSSAWLASRRVDVATASTFQAIWRYSSANA